MFAGPNGSGKSTIKDAIEPNLIGIYVNPDEVEAQVKEKGFLDFSQFEIEPAEDELLRFFEASTLLKKAALLASTTQLRIKDNKLSFSGISMNSYFASVVCDFIRSKLIQIEKSFSIETVMSSPDKIELLKNAQKLGYRTYLYYVATEDPEINISRVQNRIENGGHAVPEDKIVTRYGRSLALLVDAIQYSNRAYIFDNSGTSYNRLAEITDGNTMEIFVADFPDWFKYAVWEKLALGN